MKKIEDRKCFEPLEEEANNFVLKEGIELFEMLSSKYVTEGRLDHDAILNILCVGMVSLIKTSVPKDNQFIAAQLIYKILTQNLGK